MFYKLEESLLFDVLVVADLYLLAGLKRKCASQLILHSLNKENILDLLKLARLYDLKKLEFSCISFLAEHLLEVIYLIDQKNSKNDNFRIIKNFVPVSLLEF